MTHRRVSGLLALALFGALLIISPAAGATDPAPAPGSPGIGDPYFPTYGNGGYDVRHYDIDVYVHDATISGHTTITATATQRLSQFDLDFVLATQSVTVNGTPATFSHTTLHELVVTPAQPIADGSVMTVEVYYADQPANIDDNGVTPVFGTSPSMIVIGEPEASAWWFPANDHPLDKATYTISISTPQQLGLSALSAGRLVAHHGGSLETWVYEVNQPAATYLVFLAVGRYRLTSTTINGLPTLTAIAKDSGAAGTAAAADFAQLPTVIDFLTDQFGRYRFDALGNVMLASDTGFALETQTRPAYTPGFWDQGQDNLGVVVHEYAHQWWGDNVSVQNWRNIWMNEGFATWAQWRFSEAQGDYTANEYLLGNYNYFPATDPFWSLRIGDPGAAELFADPVYIRGAMTVQALRNKIGDDAVRQVFRRWNKQHKHGNGSTQAFQALCERVADRQLGEFFRVWLYTGAKPPASPRYGIPAGDSELMGFDPTGQPAWQEQLAATRQIAAAERGSHG